MPGIVQFASPGALGGRRGPAANRQRWDARLEGAPPTPTPRGEWCECSGAQRNSRPSGPEARGRVQDAVALGGRGVTALSVDCGEGLARHSCTNPDLTEGAKARSWAQAWQAEAADPSLGQPGSSPFESVLGPSSPVLRVPWQPTRPAGPARAAGPATAGSDAFHLPSEGGLGRGCRGARAAWQSGAREARPRGDRDPGREPPTCSRLPRPGRHHGASAARPPPVRSRW